MPKIAYEHWNPSEDTVAIIALANSKLEEYSAEGYDVTLRQLYYQFVQEGWLPSGQKHYKRLGSIMVKARMAGLVDWKHLVDRGRSLRRRPHWDNPGELIHGAALGYGIDLWEGQAFRPEVWIEKEALAGVFARPCEELDVPYFPCKGYPSVSELWEAGARRMRFWVRNDQTPVILHFGDHDPSGIDMTRDIRDRLSTFAGGRVEVRRIALNMDQIEQYAPIPFWAKVTDSRARGYIEEYGTDAWELDALHPRVLNALVRDEIEALLDRPMWEARKEQQEKERALVQKCARRWRSVVQFLADDDPDPGDTDAASDDGICDGCRAFKFMCECGPEGCINCGLAYDDCECELPEEDDDDEE